MVRVKNSNCTCGNCGTVFQIEWDLELVYSKERQMGEECQYLSAVEQMCPKCKNKIKAKLEVWEYPSGSLETEIIDQIQDSKETGSSKIEEPFIDFFDL